MQDMDYVQSKGPDLYSRSLYTFWKRTIAPPMMMNFDSAQRETCVVRETRTDTPLQALNLMNDVTYVEAARKLAERVMTEKTAPADRLTLAFRLATARKPTETELVILSAGLDAFDADVVIMMDGDGEHPPSLVPEMIRLFESGYDIVHTQRLDRGRGGFFLKRLTSRGFYWTINRLGETRIAEGSADFRLMSHEAVQALRRLPEYHRFYRGMVQWIGFSSVVLPFVPEERIAGKSKYSLRKMLRLAADGMFSFSLAPLRLGLLAGGVFLLLAAFEIVYVLSFWVRGDHTKLVPGWSSMIVMVTVSSGISMFLTGILGIYVGMIFQEVKRRPLYLVKGWTPDRDRDRGARPIPRDVQNDSGTSPHQNVSAHGDLSE
jgi:dolichol-phosphate mannosyltransferase